MNRIPFKALISLTSIGLAAFITKLVYDKVTRRKANHDEINELSETVVNEDVVEPSDAPDVTDSSVAVAEVTENAELSDAVEVVGELETTQVESAPEPYEKREIEVHNGDLRIFGVAYIPKTGEHKHPLMICSHGLAANYEWFQKYAEAFAEHGIAAYCFDFCGGGGTKSDGDTLQMSVFTEVSDLECIVASAKTWDFVDENKIGLIGHSQGGFVSSIFAARHFDAISALVLLSAGFNIPDFVHALSASIDGLPEEYKFGSITISAKYGRDVWDYDPYSELEKYSKPVLVFHGNRDKMIAMDYSELASAAFPNAEYHVVDGASHNYTKPEQQDEVIQNIMNYIHNIKFV